MSTEPATSDAPTVTLREETPYRWRIEPHGAMRVPGIVFASRSLLPAAHEDQSLNQVVNVATLPGIVKASFAMPDVHWGYGFAIGGVAATDVDAGGVVSPGGVGFDISCGVRLLVGSIDAADLEPYRERLMDALDRAVPRGLGRGGLWRLSSWDQLRRLLFEGSRFAVEQGHGTPGDLDHCEDRGALDDAELSAVSERALQRGLGQIGSLGSGNHFVEVQAVDRIYDPEAAAAFGLAENQICVMIHSGSRGLGHQICSDHVQRMLDVMPEYGIRVPDRQLACAPVDSREGRAYLGAMAAAANFGRANRQLLADGVRDAFGSVIGGCRLNLLYDVSHNLAKLETHTVDGAKRLLCVHRKGATRALPPGHADLPADLRPFGQPVLIPGSMGTASYVLTGMRGNDAFDSACHGAGRVMSRHAATRQVQGKQLQTDLEAAGVSVRASSMRGLAEEAPFSYKDVDEVVETTEQAGLARRVARLRPVGVVKG